MIEDFFCGKKIEKSHRSVCGGREELGAGLGVDPDGLVDGVDVGLVQRNHPLGIAVAAGVPPANLHGKVRVSRVGKCHVITNANAEIEFVCKFITANNMANID